MLKAQLIADGVPDENIDIVPDETEAVATALRSAREGDLVVIFGDEIERCWNQVAGHEADESDVPAESQPKAAQGYVEPDPDAFTLDPGAELIRDERGVRLARVEEEAD